MTASVPTFKKASKLLTGPAAAPFIRAVETHFPGRTVKAVMDHGVWVQQIVEVTLDGGDIVFFKINIDAGWGWIGGTCQEADITQVFQQHDLPAPPILAVDGSCAIIERPYIIQAHVGGTRLGDLLDQVDDGDAQRIYETVGHFYRRMNAIHNERSGIWPDFPNKPLPSDYMYQAEIVGGSGAALLQQGRITQRTYDRAVALWADNLDYLKAHQPSLIHYSAFPWTIYLERADGDWHVTKLSAMGDVMWWDPAYNVTLIQYPPFGEITPPRWQAFIRAYGPAPERKRSLLYLVLQRLCAAHGIYMEPPTARNQRWAAQCLDDLDTILDEIERS